VGTNPARFVIVVVLALVGVLVIANAFDGTELTAAPDVEATTSPDGQQKKDKGDGGQDGGAGQGNGQQTSEGVDPKAAADGATIAVYNATTQPGLAAAVEKRLVKAINANPAQDPNNVEGEEQASLVYYRDDKDAKVASFIARRYLRGAETAALKDLDQSTLVATLSPDAQFVITVGTDYVPE